jgi:hypothetical protein
MDTNFLRKFIRVHSWIINFYLNAATESGRG